LTNQLYRAGPDPSSTRSTSSAVATTAIPITHYRILAKQQPAATPRLVPKDERPSGGRHDRNAAIAAVRPGRPKRESDHQREVSVSALSAPARLCPCDQRHTARRLACRCLIGCCSTPSASDPPRGRFVGNQSRACAQVEREAPASGRTSAWGGRRGRVNAGASRPKLDSLSAGDHICETAWRRHRRCCGLLVRLPRISECLSSSPSWRSDSS
jgi:hypothetical protein